VWTWGGNDFGQLGNGTTTDPAGPVQVTGLANATQVAAGGRFSLAVHTVLGLVGS
jgi:alpha-tubulin suppressor-like RCC1 family protein